MLSPVIGDLSLQRCNRFLVFTPLYLFHFRVNTARWIDLKEELKKVEFDQ